MLSTRSLFFAALGAALFASDAALPSTTGGSALALATETRTMKPTVRSVKLPNGIKLQYVEQGNEDGVPLVFLHGYTDSWRSFERVLSHLPESIRAFALTQRGHGDADRPAAGYRTRDFAADVAGFMDALGLKRAIIVGHSMGSTNALRFAMDYPERTLGLVVLGTFASYRGNPVIAEFWETGVSRLTDPIEPAFAREFQESTLAQPVPATFIDIAVQESLKVPAPIWRAAFEGFLEDDFVSDLHRIRTPTLILWGTQDALCPRADQDTLRAKIPGSRLTVYEGTGHALHWEEPERFAADVAMFALSLPGLDEPHPAPFHAGRHGSALR